MSFKVYQTPEERKTVKTRGLATSTKLWLKEKSQRDSLLWNDSNPQLSKYWIVESKCYDLSTFMNSHPGGKSWLQMTRGQDITEHFITHHLDEEKVRSVLAKFYVRDCIHQRYHFKFENDGFYRTVKRKVLSKYSKDELQNYTPSKIITILLLLAWFTLLMVTAYTQSFLSATLVSFLLIGIMGVGHNFIHFRQNWYSNVIYLTGYTPKDWQIFHCISHHIYPGMQLDYQNGALEPIVYFLRNKPKNNPYVELILQPVFIFLMPIMMILKLFVFPFTKKQRPQFQVGFPLVVLALFYSLSANFWKAFALYIYIYGLFGFLFPKVQYCGHRLQEVWSEGAEKIEDFGEHVVLSTNDTDVQVTGALSYIFCAGLNIHNAHHFFPTADQSKLKPITQIIIQTCKERGVKYTSHNRLTCWLSVSRGLRQRKQFSRK